MKRQRGRGRKPGGGGGGGGNQGNRSLESNGPEVKIRGTAAQIFEKYSQYARDAQSGGDRVKYENYLQHAEHYFRIMAATMPREQRIQQIENGGGYNTTTNDDDRDNEDVASDPLKVVDQGGDDADDGDEGPEGDDAEARDDAGAEADQQGRNAEGQAAGQNGEGGEEREGRSRRRRNRNRNREGGGGNQGGNNTGNGGGDTEARSALDALAQKQAAVAGG
jgi:hypothetical protein